MPLQEQKLTGLKKRQQIENASRTMFVWVAIASVAISFCIVSAQFLYQKWSYNNRVIGAKSLAADTLQKNIKNAKLLQDQVNALVGNQDLASVKTNPSDSNTKSVLDALPSKLDNAALATSLQQAILSRSGVSIENITVPTELAQTTTTTTVSSSSDSKPIEQKFTITVSGPYDKIRTLVSDLERTIRPMKITSIDLNGSDTAMRATFDVVTYYQLSKTINIKEQVVK